MHFRVTHESVYRYDLPVTLGPHLLRLTPRREGVQIHAETIEVEPAPAKQSEETDVQGNRVTRLTFAGVTTLFRVTSIFDLDTNMPSPLAPLAAPLPWTAARDGLDTCHTVSSGPAVRAYAEEVAASAAHQPIAFLDRLAEDICNRTHLGIRPDGHARTAEETLAMREGACRDVTVLFLESARALGFAGRFVSGYQAKPAVEDGRRHLHAWGEVLLPGVGWRGWDITHGIRVTDGHVALCAAPDQAGTMPIEGGFSFTGQSVKSTFDYRVAIEVG